MNLKEYMQKKKIVVEDFLDSVLAEIQPDIPENLFRAMEYSLMAGGKRIRPLLCLESFKLATDGEEKAVLPFACGLEMVHTYSLIHDDLPVMDDDDYRRGRLSCHKVFGEATALLAGDALLTWGCAMMNQTACCLPADRVVKATGKAMDAVGPKGMVGGQILDLEAEGREVSAAELERIHRLKTSVFIEAAVMCGAVLGGAEKTTVAMLLKYGEELGLLFQITDDLLDVEGDPKITGKDSGKDAQKAKATYPSMYGIEGTRAIIEERLENAHNVLAPLGQKAEFFLELAEFVAFRKR